MSARAFAVFMGVLAIVGLLAYGVVSKGEARIQVGEPFPEIELAKLDGAGAGSIADYEGQWVLVNLWASWCGPCKAESPDLQRFHEEHGGDGFTVLGVDTKEVSDDGREFVEKYGLTYPQLHEASDDLSRELGVTGLPESFLVDPEGNVALVVPGPVDETLLAEQVEPLIVKGSS